MGGTAKMNALRSGVVVIGAVAFGYLTLKVGLKPFIEEAQLEQQRQEDLLRQSDSQPNVDDDDQSFRFDTPQSEWKDES